MASPTAPLLGIQSRRDAGYRHPAGCGGERSFSRVVVVSRICALARRDGALYGQARRTGRLSFAEKANSDSVLRRLERLAFAMCILIAGISVLMEVKPF